jgi:hypothetical protein
MNDNKVKISVNGVVSFVGDMADGFRGLFSNPDLEGQQINIAPSDPNFSHTYGAATNAGDGKPLSHLSAYTRQDDLE